MDREKILARIRKLKQMTTDNGCTEGEAMVAAQKLGDLLTEHNISMAEANIAEETAEFDFGEMIDPGRQTLHPVVNSTAIAVAIYTDTVTWREGSSIKFFGSVIDVEVALYLVQLIRNVAESDYRGWLHERTRAFGSAIRAASGGNSRVHVVNRGLKTSYMRGFGIRVSARLREMKAAQNAHAQQATGRDLVVTKTAVVKQKLAEQGMKLDPPKKGTQIRNTEAMRAGIDAGNRANLTTGIGSSGQQFARLTN